MAALVPLSARASNLSNWLRRVADAASHSELNVPLHEINCPAGIMLSQSTDWRSCPAVRARSRR